MVLLSGRQSGGTPNDLEPGIRGGHWRSVDRDSESGRVSQRWRRIRQLSRGGRRKNDRIDAAAAACVAVLQCDARPVDPEGPTDILALLDERRTNMSNSRTRLVNQLHALLRPLFAGGAPTSLTAGSATTRLRGFRARSGVDRTRVGLCRDLIADIRRLDDQLAANEKQMAHTLDEHGTRLREVDGIGAVTAARLIGRTGRASRFPTAAAYANYNGSAPVQIASADTDRHGDRQLNSALYTVAMVQTRMPASAGRAYYDKKIDEGKTPAAARRALKRHLSDQLWRIVLADEKRRYRLNQADTASAA